MNADDMLVFSYTENVIHVAAMRGLDRERVIDSLARFVAKEAVAKRTANALEEALTED